MKKIVTVEAVTSGHPDKLADLIADTILDKCLKQDKDSRVACEVLLSGNQVNLTGEITTKANVDYKQVALDVIKEVGYSIDDLEVNVNIHEQSEDIAQAVFNETEQGAGDQGIVYGYATNETYNFMPFATNLAQSLAMMLEDYRKENKIVGLLPDGKTQVSLVYENGVLDKIQTIVISTQHAEDKDIEILRQEIKKMLKSTIHFMDIDEIELLINPSGRFVKGGFEADTGLTGRKLAVDSYGGLAHHGGGAYSGKDTSKVDRSGAYMARYICKNMVASGVADACELSIAYAIGKSQPVAVDVTLFGNARVDTDRVRDYILEHYDLTPSGIIKFLDLKRPIYAQTSVGGHFGKDGLPWEQVNDVNEIRKSLF